MNADVEKFRHNFVVCQLFDATWEYGIASNGLLIPHTYSFAGQRCKGVYEMRRAISCKANPTSEYDSASMIKHKMRRSITY